MVLSEIMYPSSVKLGLHHKAVAKSPLRDLIDGLMRLG